MWLRGDGSTLAGVSLVFVALFAGVWADPLPIRCAVGLRDTAAVGGSDLVATDERGTHVALQLGAQFSAIHRRVTPRHMPCEAHDEQWLSLSTQAGGNAERRSHRERPASTVLHNRIATCSSAPQRLPLVTLFAEPMSPAHTGPAAAASAPARRAANRH